MNLSCADEHAASQWGSALGEGSVLLSRCLCRADPSRCVHLQGGWRWRLKEGHGGGIEMGDWERDRASYRFCQ